MGSALRELGKLDDAIEAFNKAISIKPDYAEAITTWVMLSKIKAS
jgi:tetratricopeptide (TPR) repeat protein